jgi:hypothetical protein
MEVLLKALATVLLFLALLSMPAFSQLCDETGSYNEVWTKEARERERSRPEREKHYATLSTEQRARVSDFDLYPTHAMVCNMGFSNGLAKVWIRGKAGFINTQGNLVIRPQFLDSGRFSEGLAPVQFVNGKWGYIDKTGNLVIRPTFDWALIFREHLALVQIGQKWGFIDTAGKIVITPQFDHANSFSEGLAHVQIYKGKYYSGYIDRTGKWVIQPLFNGGDDFHEGRAIADQDVADEKGNYKYTESYEIDKTGRKLRKVEGSRTPYTPQLHDDLKISPIFEGYKTGYKAASGKYIWKPTN